MMMTTSITYSLRKVAFFIIATLLICCSVKTAIASSTSLNVSSTRRLRKDVRRNSKSNSSRSSVSSDPDSTGSLGHTRRATLFARTTLLNLDIEEVTPEHLIFFENEFMNAFNELHQDAIEKKDDINYEYGPHIRSLIVQDVVKGNPSSGRRRRGRSLRAVEGEENGMEVPDDRSLGFYNQRPFFDFGAFFEVACTLCRSDDDDDRRILFQNPSNDDNVTTAAAAHRLFEKTLLNRLRRGKFQEFRDVEDLKIVYMNDE